MESPIESVKITDFNIIKHPDALSSDCFHFSVTHPTIDFTGFGSAFDEKLALKIAINECLERHCFSQSRIELGTKTTSGFAAHNTAEQARESALCELLERDAVLTGWLLKKPATWLKPKDVSNFVNDQLRLFAKSGFDVRFGLTSISNDRFCMIGVLLGGEMFKDFGAAFSSSCHKSIDLACLAMLKELRRAATVVCNREDSNYRLDFSNQDSAVVKSANDHFLYYANPVNLRQIQWYLASHADSQKKINFNVAVKDIEPPLSPSWEFHIAHADSEDLQKFYFGRSKFDRINRQRLKNTWNIGDKLNKQLHVLP